MEPVPGSTTSPAAPAPQQPQQPLPAEPKPRKGSAMKVLLVVLLVVGVGVGMYYYRQMAIDSLYKQVSSLQDQNAKLDTDSTTSPASATDYTGWGKYCSNIEKACFRFPADWTLTSIPINAAQFNDADAATLKSPDGVVVDWNSYVSGIGGGCDASAPKIEIATVVKNTNGLYSMSYGVAGKVTGMATVATLVGKVPVVGKTDSCVILPTFKSKDGKRDMWLKASGVVATDGTTTEIPKAERLVVQKILASYSY